MEDEKDNVVTEEDSNKTLSFDEVLASNKEYQAEFDRRLAKSNNSFLETKKSEWEKEYTERLEKEKNEAEKLAKMSAEQKLNYRIHQLEEELESKNNMLNANNLKEATSKVLIDKGIPNTYLSMFDFSKENAETINQKIEMLSNIRTQDLQDSLNKSLRQEPPRYVKNDDYDEIDPYIEGFMSEL